MPAADVDVNRELNRLVRFALLQGLIEAEDAVWAANGLIGELGLPDLRAEPVADDLLPGSSPDGILERILDWAEAAGIIEGGPEERDLLDTRLMGVLTPRPSDVVERFRALYRTSPRRATDYFYGLGVASNYVRSARTARNIRWRTGTDFGELDVTINLSKPEKDPRDIARAGKAPATGYPRCLLCRENEGFFGHPGHPARQNLRLIPLDLRQGQSWFLQYSPYSYYDEHCIVLNGEHVPMAITRETFENLLRFLDLFPHYFVGSNADLPIVGGSILSHDHYQGGRFVFALDRAQVEREYPARSGVAMGRVNWPMSVLRLASCEAAPLIDAACGVLEAWRGWSAPEVGVLSRTGDVPHNTVTPIARRRDGRYELDLVLRNNRTSPEHPLGIFHPHADVQHIKKENIGLIEVLGLAILPPRLKWALSEMAEAWLRGEVDLAAHPALAAHDPWYRGLRERHVGLEAEAVPGMFRDEVGRVFARVLSDCGVFKRDDAGLEAFDQFAAAL